MEKYVFSRWEAIDLFVKIIAKYEEKDKLDVERALLKYLIKYKKADVSSQVAALTLKLKADEYGSQHYYPNFLSDLSTEIENGVPIVRSKNRVKLILDYIGEGSVEDYETNSQGGQKSKSLEGSFWWMYSHEYYINKTTQQKVPFITRDVVSLAPFAYVTVSATKNHDGDNIGLQHYSGSYYIKYNRYLFLDLRISETKEKEFRAVIDIGAGSTVVGEIYTGYYLNASNNLYFGPLLLEKIPNQDKLSAQIFEENDPNVDDAVWKYFAGIEFIPYKVIASYGSKGRLKGFLET